MGTYKTYRYIYTFVHIYEMTQINGNCIIFYISLPFLITPPPPPTFLRLDE